MNEAAFSNCNAEDYINIDKDVQTEPDAVDIDALVQNFRESQKERKEEEEEEENDIVRRRRKVQCEDSSGCCQKFKVTAGICRTTECFRHA